MIDQAVIGIDLGGTKIAGGIFHSGGDLKHKEVIFIENKTGPAVGASILSMVDTLLAKSQDLALKVSAVGVAVPGIYHPSKGTVWAPNISGWEDYPLMSELRAHLGKNMGVCIDSDRACYILGEAWKGAAIGCKHAVFLAVGTGIGAGILVDGKVLRGAHDIAGAMGWMALTDTFLPGYKECGCFEYHASGEGLARRAQQLQKALPNINAGAKNFPMTTPQVFEKYELGNPVAQQAIKESIQLWGKGVANLVSLFNPEKIIFGGGVFGPAGRFLPDIQQEAIKWAQPISMIRVNLEVSQLGGEAGLYGAAYLALNKSPAP